MSRYDEFCEAHEIIQKLEKFVNEESVGGSAFPELKEMAETRIAMLKASFETSVPVPVEPVKPKAKRGDVDGAVKERIAFLRSDNVDPFHDPVDWPGWAAEHKLNRKSVLAAVRRHTEKNKT